MMARRILSIIEKELYVYFKYFHSEVAWAILLPVFMIWTMRVGIGDTPIEGINVDYASFIAPGLIMMTVLSTGLFNTGFVMMFEKSYSDAFEGLIQTPVSTFEVSLAKCLSGTVKSVINGVVSLAVILIFINIKLALSWVLLVPLFAVCGFFFSCLGLVMGTYLKRGYQLGTLGNLVILPLTFFGGLFFSVSQLAPDLQAVVNANPVTWMISALREVTIYGGWDVGWGMLGTCLACVPLFLATNMVFKRLVIN